MDCDLDVVIIGAGLSGLSCCYHILKASKNIKLIVLEAKDRIGGRLLEATLPTVNGTDSWDMGGHWVSSAQHNVMKLINEFGLKTQPQFAKGRKKIAVHSFDNVLSYSGLIPSIGIFELVDLGRVLNKLEKMAAKIDPDHPIKCKQAAKWDKITVETFVQNSFCFQTSKEVFACSLRVVFGCEPSQLSLFYLLYYSILAGGFRFLVDQVDGAAQEFGLQGTTYQIIRKLQDKIGSARIVLNSPVTSIDQSADDKVVITTMEGKVYTSKFAVCTAPPHLVNQIQFKPALPNDRVQLGMRMPIGHLIKCTLTYKSNFWRDNGDSGESAVILPSESIGPLCVTFDATSHGGNPALVTFIGGEHAIYWSNKTTEERKQAVIECLVGIFGDKSKSELLHYIDKDWSKEEYVGGCPVGIMQPGCLMYFHHSLRAPFKRVHWGGTETARRWVGYLDGAVESGVRSGNEVLSRIVGNSLTPLSSCSPVFSPLLPWRKVHESPKTVTVLKWAVVVGVIGATAYVAYSFFESNKPKISVKF